MVKSIFKIEILFLSFRFQKLYIFEHTTPVALRIKTMRKIIVMLSALILALIPLGMISPAQAHIELIQWLPPYVSISGSQVIYKDGETASLVVSVLNDVSPSIKMNVSKVVIEFYTMGKNKTLDLLASPHQILTGNTEIFTVDFTAIVTEAIADLQHKYNIIVEYVNATTGPKKVVGYLEKTWGSWPLTWLYFVVVSTVQVDAMDSLANYTSYYDQYRYYYWQDIVAQQNATQAVIEKGIGDTHYQRGDYASATTQYNKAVTLWEKALVAESKWRTTSQEASLNGTLTTATATLKEADAAMIQANAAMTNTYGWMVIGVGSVLIGIGVIIYGLRKPKTP